MGMKNNNEEIILLWLSSSLLINHSTDERIKIIKKKKKTAGIQGKKWKKIIRPQIHEMKKTQETQEIQNCII